MLFDEKMRLTENEWQELLQYNTSEYLDVLCGQLLKNRYRNLPLLNKVLYLFKNDSLGSVYSEAYLKTNGEMYRSRIYDITKDSEPIKTKNSPFQGYNAEQSFVPPKQVIYAGRANKYHQQILYTAISEKGAIYEVKPNVDNIVSVAKVVAHKTLKIFNLAHVNMGIEAADKIKTKWLQGFLLDIAQSFYKVYLNKKDYYITQYISSYAKTLGFDGIAYLSSHNRSHYDEDASINFAIYNYENCEVISSKKVYITNVTVEYRNMN